MGGKEITIGQWAVFDFWIIMGSALNLLSRSLPLVISWWRFKQYFFEFVTDLIFRVVGTNLFFLVSCTWKLCPSLGFAGDAWRVPIQFEIWHALSADSGNSRFGHNTNEELGHAIWNGLSNPSMIERSHYSAQGVIGISLGHRATTDKVLDIFGSNVFLIGQWFRPKSRWYLETWKVTPEIQNFEIQHPQCVRKVP